MKNFGTMRMPKKFGIKNPLFVILSILTFTILIFEFFYNLKHEYILRYIVIGLDIVLLLIFFLLVIQKIRQNKTAFFDFIRQEKADTAYLFIILCLLFMPRLAAGLVIVRLLIAAFMHVLETPVGNKLIVSLNLRPSQTLALSFIGLIGVGTILLTFPASTTNGQGASFIDALFTITSASCVSGLTIFNINDDFTRFGQAVILLSMQAGGLGIMVLSAAFAVLVGGAIPLRRQAGLTEVLDISSPEGLRSLIRAVTATTIMTEFIGAILLFILWPESLPSTGERIWWSIFHSVSAFCNCGISLAKTSLMVCVDHPLICFVFIGLITMGGIGFFVISDLINPEVWAVKKPRAIWNRLQIQSKVVLLATLVLDSLGMLLFLFFEYDGALHGLNADKKILASLFHAVNLRSAGFNIVPIENIVGPTIIFSIAFMFIGSAPGSTGGGIKTTTAAVSFMALRAMLRGREEVELFGRRMPVSIVSRSLSIVLVASVVVVIFLTMLSATQNIEFEHLFFEVVSAFGTVGLSLNATTMLNDTGKILIILVMYVGRIGPLTLAMAIGERKLSQRFKLPRGRIAVG